MSTIEILLAFAILFSIIGAVNAVSFGNQSASVDTELAKGALYKAQQILEDARATSRNNFNAVASNTTTSGIYTQTTTVVDGPCQKVVTAGVAWQTQPTRPQAVAMTTQLTDIPTALALGGDCLMDSPTSSWDNPATFADGTFNPGKPTGIDVFRGYAYLTSDHTPYLLTFDVQTVSSGDHLTPLVYSNGFDAGVQLNDIDVAAWRDPVTGVQRRFAYVTRNDTINQFAVIEVTGPFNPTLIVTRSLANVDPAGSYPQGWRVSVYAGRAYVTTRETAGPELHVFDVSTPANAASIVEKGSGTEIGRTINDLIITRKVVGVSAYLIAYLATSGSTKELMAMDVTDPTNVVEKTAASQDLPGSYDGESVFLLNSTLYLGRASAPGSDLYVYETKDFDPGNAASGLQLVGQQDIGTGVIGIRVIDPFAFVATTKANQEFQVWRVAHPSPLQITLSPVSQYNFSNVISGGLDYEGDRVYATGQSTPNLRIITSSDYTLTNSNDIMVVQGSAASTTITATLTSGSSSPVSFSTSALPAGASASFASNPCTPTCSTTLTITAAGTTPTGSSSVIVTGAPGGKVTTFTLTVTAGPFDYILGNNAPGNLSVNRPNPVNANITRTLTSGATQGVALSFSSTPPSDMTGTFTNMTANPANPCTGSCVSTLTIHTTAVTPKATYTITVTGTPPGSSGPQTTTFTLKVK